jgi:hypothetical protein
MNKGSIPAHAIFYIHNYFSSIRYVCYLSNALCIYHLRRHSLFNILKIPSKCGKNNPKTLLRSHRDRWDSGSLWT